MRIRKQLLAAGTKGAYNNLNPNSQPNPNHNPTADAHGVPSAGEQQAPFNRMVQQREHRQPVIPKDKQLYDSDGSDDEEPISLYDNKPSQPTRSTGQHQQYPGQQYPGQNYPGRYNPPVTGGEHPGEFLAGHSRQGVDPSNGGQTTGTSNSKYYPTPTPTAAFLSRTSGTAPGPPPIPPVVTSTAGMSGTNSQCQPPGVTSNPHTQDPYGSTVHSTVPSGIPPQPGHTHTHQPASNNRWVVSVLCSEVLCIM